MDKFSCIEIVDGTWSVLTRSTMVVGGLTKDEAQEMTARLNVVTGGGHIAGLRAPGDRWIDAPEPPTDAEMMDRLRVQTMQKALDGATYTFGWMQPDGAGWELEQAGVGEIVMRGHRTFRVRVRVDVTQEPE